VPGDERQQLTSGQFLVKSDRPVATRSMKLEDTLCQIDSDDGNLGHGCSLLL